MSTPEQRIRELERELARERERTTALELRVKAFEQALRRSYQYAITPRRPADAP